MKLSHAQLSHAVALVRGELAGDVAQASALLDECGFDPAKVAKLTDAQAVAFIADYADPIRGAQFGTARVLGVVEKTPPTASSSRAFGPLRSFDQRRRS